MELLDSTIPQRSWTPSVVRPISDVVKRLGSKSLVAAGLDEGEAR